MALPLTVTLRRAEEELSGRHTLGLTGEPNWGSYEVFDPGLDEPLHEVSRAEARRYFESLMTTKAERISLLARLVETDGIKLDGSEASVQQLNDWFVRNVERDPDEPMRLRGRWLSVAQDIGLYLGDLILASSPHLRWKLHEGGKTNWSYQRPVVAGFRSVDPHYTIDLTFAISQYGLEALDEEEFSRGRFLEMVQAACEYA